MRIADLGAPPISRAVVAIGLGTELRATFAELAAGRTLAIGYFTSRLCGSILIGDIDLEWLEAEPGGRVSLPAGFVALAPLESVALVVDERLLEVLATAGPTIVQADGPFRRGLAIRLDAPEAWLDFLESPGARRLPRPD